MKLLPVASAYNQPHYIPYYIISLLSRDKIPTNFSKKKLVVHVKVVPSSNNNENNHLRKLQLQWCSITMQTTPLHIDDREHCAYI